LPRKLAVIADDLTGANDTAAQFASSGVRTVVLLSLNNAEGLVRSHDVVAYSTETREASAEDAYREVRAAAERLRSLGAEAFYKKVDSTLRGNLGGELDALMDAGGTGLCLLAPAYPAQGRITVGGYHLVNDVPLARSHYAADPTMTVRESHVPGLVRAQSSRRVGHLPLSTVMKGPAAVAEAVKAMAEDSEILVADAVTDADLHNVAEGLLSADPQALPAGSAGLAAELPEPLGLVSRKPVLVISGSPNPVSVRQTLEAQRATGAKLLEVDGRTALLEAEGRERSLAALVEEIRQLRPMRTPLILATTLGENVAETHRKGREEGLGSGEVASRVARTLSELAARAAETKEFAGLVLLGGVTSFEVLKALGAKAIVVQGEVAAGIPVGRLVGGRWHGLPVVTKAGGFGGPDAVAAAARQLGRLQASG